MRCVIGWTGALVAGMAVGAPMVWAQRADTGEINRDAVKLLRRMVQAEISTPYIAREATILADGAGSEHLVKHAPGRGVRREAVRPRGPIVLDDGKRSFRFNPGGPVVSGETAQPRPSQALKRVQEIIRRIRQGTLRVQVVGEDRVAGRVADIVEVSAPDIPGTVTRRFWIDRATGLRLRTEEKDGAGKVLSGSYYLSLDLSPQFGANDFVPPAGATALPRPNLGDRRRFRTIDEAAKAGYAVTAPTYIPVGYTLRQVEAAANGTHIALRYANGLSALSVALLKNGVPPRVRPFLRSDGTAFVPFPQGKNGFFRSSDGGDAYLLIGDLPESELRRIATSLR